MKINKETWHYKLWKKSFHYRENVPEETDLCRYCHKVFWGVVGIGALVAMILVGIGCLLSLLFMLAYQGFWLHTIPTLIATVVVVGTITTIVLYNKWLNSSRVSRTVSNPSLVSHWMSARKQSVCPLIEFESDEPATRPSFYSEEDEDDIPNDG